MAEFTKEEQVKAIYDLKVGYALGHADIAMLKSMARQLLASMEQEPVAWVTMQKEFCDDERTVITNRVDADRYSRSCYDLTPLYAAPQLPQPAVLSVPDEIPKLKDGRGFKYVKDGVHYSLNYANGWNQCRAAMLQGAEPVQRYTLRDGWVAVPIEPTPQMNKAGWTAMNEHDAIDPTYRAMLEAAPDFREISNSSTKHFRENAETSTKCWCRTCRPVNMANMRFVVCPECGNKRCPHANDHRNACTGSNEPGQEGSAYPAAPQQEVKLALAEGMARYGDTMQKLADNGD